MLASIKELEAYELIGALLGYTKNLEAMVLELRQEVNALIPPLKHKPYENIHSDIYEVFDDYPACQKFKQLFEKVISVCLPKVVWPTATHLTNGPLVPDPDGFLKVAIFHSPP
ncbi:hypothetical protein P378_16260 [Desulforamulus profundi]|uniref:Uncharacterized protein n=1 Tax=Desulforamulus profundi TaxID=1383067 RepID=A0A2C6M5K2_9FIRM|nr:hypothetical protein [Desulforamulus profundi]PHJ37497.1 hypothetical protein P378_16260 [Desulforamulus profundi]